MAYRNEVFLIQFPSVNLYFRNNFLVNSIFVAAGNKEHLFCTLAKYNRSIIYFEIHLPYPQKPAQCQ